MAAWSEPPPTSSSEARPAERAGCGCAPSCPASTAGTGPALQEPARRLRHAPRPLPRAAPDPQPIAENAVRHGRDPRKGPPHASIRTRRTAQGPEATVTDDGRGFDPKDDDEPHVTPRNIQQRLEPTCAGTPAATAGDEGGTRATVAIPDAPKGSLAGIPKGSSPLAQDPNPLRVLSA